MFPSIGFSIGASQKSKATTSGFEIYEHAYMGGAWTAVDRAGIDQRGAILAQNVRYFGKQVETRYGWGPAFNITESAGNHTYYSLFNWLSSLGNYLVWLDILPGSQAIRTAKISDNPPTATTLTSFGAGHFGAVYATAGPRLFIAHWAVDALNNVTTSDTGVVITNISGTFHADPMLPGPASTTLVPATPPTEPGTGSVTAGLHNIGLRMQHRSGFLGRPGPDNGSKTPPDPTSFVPIQFTSTGGKNLRWNFTPGATWPADVVSVQLLMSPVNNPNRYFLIPGATQAVTGGAATVVNITFDISDEALVSGAAALECTDSLNFYTNPAFNPTSVAHIGNRMFYVTQLFDNNSNPYSVIFASDPGQYQQVSLSQHVIQLPNQLQITHVIGVQGAIHILGPHWTYVTQDTGGVPVTWPNPQIVDGKKGVLFPNCIDVNVNGKYAWIGDKTGLYYFDGAYSELPISWKNNDQWKLIEFPQQNLTIKDDSLHHVVRVLAIVLPGTLKIFKWDYTNGIDESSVRFDADDVPVNGGGGMEIVQNDLFGSTANAQKSPELWISPQLPTATVAYFAREKNPAYDTLVYRDDSNGGGAALAIHASYSPCVFPAPGGDYDYLAHQGCKLRISGAGAIQPKVFSYDSGSNVPLRPSTNLSTLSDGKAIFRGYLVSPNGFVYLFDQNVLDGHFILSEVDMYYGRFGSVI